ncbi:MAG: DUF2510 domain-containing protein [Acidimicrobiales bacterium]
MTDSTPGWQADPSGRHDHRYWDGTQWTDDVADAGVAGTDPYDAALDADTASAADEPTVGDGPVSDAPGWDDPITVGAGSGEPTAVSAPLAWGDPTTGPASGEPPAASGAPAPPAPPTYALPASSADEPRAGGSKKGLLIGAGILAIVAIIAAVALLSGGDDDDERDRIHAELVASISEEGGLSDADADCFADHLIDEIGVDRLKDVDFDADEPPADLEDDLTAASFSGLEACNIDAGSDGEDGSDDTDTTEPDDVDEPDEADAPIEDLEDLPQEVRDQLVDTYESMGIERDKAECLTDKIVEGIESGELDEEQAMTEFFSFFADCDIDPSELSGN